jgi:hypothetical protein
MTAAELLEHTDLALHNPASGRLDARRLPAELGVPVKRVALAIGSKPAGVRKVPDAPRLQNGLARLERIWLGLVRLFAGNKRHARVFLNAPHPALQGKPPIAFIEEPAVLETLLDRLERRQPI